jgi:hypothetical protein
VGDGSDPFESGFWFGDYGHDLSCVDARKKAMDHKYRGWTKCAISLWGTCFEQLRVDAIALVIFGAIPLVALRMLGQQRHIVERILLWGVLSLWYVLAFATLRAFIFFGW